MTKQPTRHNAGIKAAKKNLANDPDFYRKIGSRGGAAPHIIRGFQMMTPEKIRAAGAKGGKISKRTFGNKSKAIQKTLDVVE